MKRKTLVILALSIVSSLAMAGTLKPFSVKPVHGFVPDEKTALRIAEAVLEPIYGQKQLNGERPFKATIENGLWTVQGTLPEGLTGGVATVQIWQSDAKIEAVMHTK